MGGFVMVDGLEGAGKGVIIQAFKRWAEDKKLTILDLKEYCDEHRTLPQPQDIASYDAIFSTEPTHAYAGRAISEEMIVDNKREYSVLSTAWAFSLDREILYNRVIIPALKQGKFIFQERGVVTSLVYQPAQGRITLKELLDMPGNRLAIRHAPSCLFIARVEPRTVIERLQKDGRLGTDIFKSLNFQRKIDERFSSLWLKSLFERFGTRVAYIDTNSPATEDDTQKTVIAQWEEFLKDPAKPSPPQPVPSETPMS